MRRIGVTMLALCLCAATTAAQGPRGADTLSAAAIADSLRALKEIDAHLRSEPNDAAAWYRRAIIAWALSDRSNAPNAPSVLDASNLGRMADSSLRLAAELAPANARYRLMLGRFFLTRGNIAIRVLANAQFSKALDLARKGTDSLVLSEAALEAGRIQWRRYDSFKNRRMQSGNLDMERSISAAMQPTGKAAGEMTAISGNAEMYANPPLNSLKDVEALLKAATMPLSGDLNGAIEYEQASALFREAYAAAPTNARAFRSVAMLLADSSRWKELDVFASAQIAKIPWDPDAWMALGLARHRAGNSRGGALAFDSAMALISPLERGRLDRLERILRPGDSTRMQRASAASRAATEDLYWRFADPLWTRDGNETRTEFLARVEFADLRWTVEELGLHGADTDRGDVYIRYGPPDIAAALAPKGSSEGTDIVTFWLYKSGLMFSFSGMPTYGSARTPLADRAMAAAIKDAQPVRWDNIAVYRIDSMPVQVARFRGGRDSVDVMVATTPPYSDLMAASEVREAVHSDFWLLRDGMRAVYHDTSSVTADGVQSWTRRVAPGGYVYRAEVGAAGSLRAARITAPVLADADPRSGFSSRGFGISDVMLATAVGQAPPGARWTGLGAVPLTGGVAHAGSLSLVWENYEFGQKDGSAQYTVALTMVHDRSGVGRIAASVIGALASVARIDRQPDRVVVRFERALPWSAAFADQLQVGLGDTAPGSYALMLEITDKVTGRKATRATTLIVR